MSRYGHIVGWTVASIGALAAALWWITLPRSPDAFYTQPASMPAQPGVLLRQEPFDRKVPAGSQAWRILYSTTRADGVPAVASALVMAASGASRGPRPIVAWTHGTTGVAEGCAPSLLDDPFANVPALQSLLDRGWVFVATDYVGQGTVGPHPYLIGEGQARSALDAVRASRQMKDIETSEQTVVWGHSQGGNAALWAGILAPAYAPDVPLSGVAAIAPATDLPALLRAIEETLVGRLMSAYVLRAYSEEYPDVEFSSYASGWSGKLASDMARRCLSAPKALFAVVEALAVGGSIFTTPPTTGPLGTRLLANTPAQPLTQPLLIAQGLADDLVLPDIQERFVRSRCAAGQTLQFLRYAAQDHLSIVAPNSPLKQELIDWTADRFAGESIPGGCLVEQR